MIQHNKVQPGAAHQLAVHKVTAHPLATYLLKVHQVAACPLAAYLLTVDQVAVHSLAAYLLTAHQIAEHPAQSLAEDLPFPLTMHRPRRDTEGIGSVPTVAGHQFSWCPLQQQRGGTT